MRSRSALVKSIARMDRAASGDNIGFSGSRMRLKIAASLVVVIIFNTPADHVNDKYYTPAPRNRAIQRTMTPQPLPT